MVVTKMISWKNVQVDYIYIYIYSINDSILLVCGQRH